MCPNERKEMFDGYFDSTYKQVNILTEEQFNMASEGFERAYQGYIPEDKSSAILDVGCGCGHFLYYLKKKDYTNFFGIDISESQVKYCREQITDKVQQADAMDYLKNKNEVYDVIAAHDVLEHVPKNESRSFLKLILASLKPKGIVIARVPNMSNPLGLDARYSDFTHEVGFTGKSLYQLFWSAGFRDIEILPPQKIPVRSFRNFVRRILIDLLQRTIRLFYYIQDYTVPQNLDKNLIVIARKINEE